MSKQEKWSDYWQNEGATGEVFVNKDGHKHSALKQFWQHQVANLTSGDSLIDLACGAGSIFADLPEQHGLALSAADLSAVALQHLVAKFPQVETTVCSADDLPFDDNQFDMVVSQFGIEYAGPEAFMEAYRILKPGGRMTVLCHIQDGYIDSKNKMELVGAELAHALNFVARAKQVTAAVFANQPDEITVAMDEFVSVEPLLAASVNKSSSGPHVHLYNGFKQLFMKRQAYTQQDILDWLDGMDQEIQKSIERLTSMRKAAQSESNMQAIAERLGKPNQQVDYKPLVLPDHNLPVAWHFELIKAD
ncbi:class I SAM-dependent methyltransferase [Aliiglaciecola litoralis]|uniref:Methyltransferase domain-containing protein n=1 Tax=Aliiglaciecola litoralis TaxID=582857 RepID=A0ABP3X1B0_9ALTE